MPQQSVPTGLNFYPAAFGEMYGWNAGMITPMAGIAGWVALIGAVIFAQLIARIGTCFGRYDFIQANKAIAPLNTIVRQSGIVLAGILSQTVYGYSGLYVILGIADIIGIILVVTLIKTKKGNRSAAA